MISISKRLQWLFVGAALALAISFVLDFIQDISKEQANHRTCQLVRTGTSTANLIKLMGSPTSIFLKEDSLKGRVIVFCYSGSFLESSPVFIYLKTSRDSLIVIDAYCPND